MTTGPYKVFGPGLQGQQALGPGLLRPTQPEKGLDPPQPRPRGDGVALDGLVGGGQSQLVPAQAEQTETQSLEERAGGAVVHRLVGLKGGLHPPRLEQPVSLLHER